MVLNAADRASSYRDARASIAEIKSLLPRGVRVADIEVDAESLELPRAATIFEQYGVLVVRALHREIAAEISADAEQAVGHALQMAEAGLLSEVSNESDGTTHHLGWVTPDQTLFVPAPSSHARSKQVMVLGLDYYTAASMLRAATDARTLDVVHALLDSPEAVELFGKGQCFYKEGIPGMDGGNPKLMHQDSAYFMFGRGGAVASLSYTRRTDLRVDNGPLYVVPGSHRWGHIAHVDTPSHLGLPAHEWSFDNALVIEGDAGDAIFFHIHMIHGSPPNRSAAPRATFINRYIAADDYQAFFATDVAMRAKARNAMGSTQWRAGSLHERASERAPHPHRRTCTSGMRALAGGRARVRLG